MVTRDGSVSPPGPVSSASYHGHARAPHRPASRAKQFSYVHRSWTIDLFGSQIQGDLIGASQWRIYQGVAKEFGSATSDSSP